MTVKRTLRSYPEALTVADAAALLQVSTKTVYSMIRSEKISAVKIGRTNIIAKSTLLDYLYTAGMKRR